MSLFVVGMVAQMMFTGIESKADRVAEQKKTVSLFERTFKSSTFKTTKGSTYNLKNIKEEIVLLNFWASWCFPCVEEFKSLTKFVEAYKGKVKVLGINNDTEDELIKIKKSEKKHKLNFESVFDEDSEITSKFNLSVIPATYIFHNGKYVYHSNEQVDFMSDEFKKRIDQLLKK